MAEKNCATTPAARDIGKEAIACIPARGLDRHFRLRGESTNIDRAKLKTEVVLLSKFLDKTSVRVALLAA